MDTKSQFSINSPDFVMYGFTVSHSSNIGIVTCRIIDELAELSRQATPDPRSHSSTTTPHPDAAIQPNESDGSRSRSDEGLPAR